MISELEWRTDPDYRIPAADQLAMLDAIAPDFLATLTGYFQKKKANERRIAKK
jgi:hypothetical protein